VAAEDEPNEKVGAEPLPNIPPPEDVDDPEKSPPPEDVDVPPKSPPPPDPKEKEGAELVAVELEPKEKTPLFVSDVVEEAADEDATPLLVLPPKDDPPLPKENRPAPFAEEAGLEAAEAEAAAEAAVVEVVKVSLGFSPEEETQKEKVGLIEELQLLVGARV